MLSHIYSSYSLSLSHDGLIDYFDCLLLELIQMGGGQSRSVDLLRFVEREWEVLREENGVRVLRNVQSEKIESDLMPIVLDPRRNIEKQYDIYNYRRTQENALVAVYAVQNSKSSESSFCGNSQMLRVAVERTVVRYRDLGQLTFPQVLYVLSESIRGFDDCFSRIGQFEITNRMIALNTRGMAKVWLNQNFADNHPVDEKPQLQMTCVNQSKLKASRQELIMLQNLLNVIQEKCENGRFREDFRGKIYSKSNFIDAYNQVQLFCRDQRLDIPDHISLNGSHANTSNNSISLQASNFQKPVNATFGNNNYQPRQTLIKNLSFSQANEKHYIQSPQLKKYDAQERPQFVAISELPRSAPFSKAQSPRFPQQQPGQVQFNQPQQPGQIKFNYQPQTQDFIGSFAPRRF